MPIPLGILAQAGRSIGGGGSYELIESVILTSSQSSVTFSNLGNYSSTYKHLQIRAVVSHTNSGGNALAMRLNGDTASNYGYHELTGNGSNAGSYGAGSQSSILAVVGIRQNLSNTSFGAGVIDILDAYSTTKNKTVRALSGHASTESIVLLTSGVRLNTEALSSITLVMSSGNIGANSRFSLYGIKG